MQRSAEPYRSVSDIPEQVDFIDAMPEYDLEMYRHKKMKTTPETALDALKETLPVLEGVSEWDVEHIHEALFAKIADLGVRTAGCCGRCVPPFPVSSLHRAAA